MTREKPGPFTGAAPRKAEHGTRNGYQTHVTYGTEHDEAIGRLYAEFVRPLTADSVHADRRRRDYNQAVFMADGRPVWTEITLDMITGKFEKAARNLGLPSLRGAV